MKVSVSDILLLFSGTYIALTKMMIYYIFFSIKNRTINTQDATCYRKLISLRLLFNMYSRMDLFLGVDVTRVHARFVWSMTRGIFYTSITSAGTLFTRRISHRRYVTSLNDGNSLSCGVLSDVPAPINRREISHRLHYVRALVIRSLIEAIEARR